LDFYLKFLEKAGLVAQMQKCFTAVNTVEGCSLVITLIDVADFEGNVIKKKLSGRRGAFGGFLNPSLHPDGYHVRGQVHCQNLNAIFLEEKFVEKLSGKFCVGTDPGHVEGRAADTRTDVQNVIGWLQLQTLQELLCLFGSSNADEIVSVDFFVLQDATAGVLVAVENLLQGLRPLHRRISAANFSVQPTNLVWIFLSLKKFIKKILFIEIKLVRTFFINGATFCSPQVRSLQPVM
jgi:hypothetical protein